MIWKLSVMHLCLFFISDIDMYNKNNAVELKVNGTLVQLSNQIYQHPSGNFPKTILAVTFTQFSKLKKTNKKKTSLLTLSLFLGQIHIRQRGEGIALYAPFYGLQEIYFEVNALKVKQKNVINSRCNNVNY